METEPILHVQSSKDAGAPVPMVCDGLSCDPARRQVAADGRILHLTPKAFDLLVILMREAPRVVRKSELHRQLWRGIFVTDAALTSLVKELRRVLRSRNSGAPLIKTAHGIGYAFEGAVLVPAGPSAGHWLVGPYGRHQLQSGENTIGRDPGSSVWLDDADVSRRHARVVLDCGAAVIEDLASKNGTFVGTTRVHGPVPLRDGDTIRAGSVPLTYREPTHRASASTETGIHIPPA